MISTGEVFRTGGRSLNFVLSAAGRWWFAALKGTEDGRELYLQTVFPTRERFVRSVRRRGERLR